MRYRLLFVWLVVLSVSAHAQWLNFPTPNTPRTADGKPKLAAPTPRTAEGRPDLSGVWMHEVTTVAGTGKAGFSGDGGPAALAGMVGFAVLVAWATVDNWATYSPEARADVKVEEVTVAGNLLDMFTRIEGIGNDLTLRDRTASPTLLVGRMVVAGN